MADEIKELKKKLDKESKARANIEADVEAKKKEIEAFEEELATAEAKNVELNAALFERENMGKSATIEPEEKTPELTKAEKKLIVEACDAYGIPEEHIFKARIEAGAAVVITAGGTRIRYRHGDEKAEDFRRLDPIKIDGKIRKKMKPAMKREKK